MAEASQRHQVEFCLTKLCGNDAPRRSQNPEVPTVWVISEHSPELWNRSFLFRFVHVCVLTFERLFTRRKNIVSRIQPDVSLCLPPHVCGVGSELENDKFPSSQQLFFSIPFRKDHRFPRILQKVVLVQPGAAWNSTAFLKDGSLAKSPPHSELYRWFLETKFPSFFPNLFHKLFRRKSHLTEMKGKCKEWWIQWFALFGLTFTSFLSNFFWFFDQS